jgi:hypothetical protein
MENSQPKVPYLAVIPVIKHKQDAKKSNSVFIRAFPCSIGAGFSVEKLRELISRYTNENNTSILHSVKTEFADYTLAKQDVELLHRFGCSCDCTFSSSLEDYVPGSTPIEESTYEPESLSEANWKLLEKAECSDQGFDTQRDSFNLPSNYIKEASITKGTLIKGMRGDLHMATAVEDVNKQSLSLYLNGNLPHHVVFLIGHGLSATDASAIRLNAKAIADDCGPASAEISDTPWGWKWGTKDVLQANKIYTDNDKSYSVERHFAQASTGDICVYNRGLLTLPWILKEAKKANVKKLVLIVDSCHSGAWVDEAHRCMDLLGFVFPVAIHSSTSRDEESYGLRFVPAIVENGVPFGEIPSKLLKTSFSLAFDLPRQTPQFYSNKTKEEWGEEFWPLTAPHTAENVEISDVSQPRGKGKDKAKFCVKNSETKGETRTYKAADKCVVDAIEGSSIIGYKFKKFRHTHGACNYEIFVHYGRVNDTNNFIQRPEQATDDCIYLQKSLDKKVKMNYLNSATTLSGYCIHFHLDNNLGFVNESPQTFGLAIIEKDEEFQDAAHTSGFSFPGNVAELKKKLAQYFESINFDWRAKEMYHNHETPQKEDGQNFKIDCVYGTFTCVNVRSRTYRAMQVDPTRTNMK